MDIQACLKDDIPQVSIVLAYNSIISGIRDLLKGKPLLAQVPSARWFNHSCTKALSDLKAATNSVPKDRALIRQARIIYKKCLHKRKWELKHEPGMTCWNLSISEIAKSSGG